MHLLVTAGLSAGSMEHDLDDNGVVELYSNLFQVGHNPTEFLVDFGRQFEGADSRFYARVITTPTHAKLLLRLLEESIRVYENKFGAIPTGVSS